MIDMLIFVIGFVFALWLIWLHCMMRQNAIRINELEQGVAEFRRRAMVARR